MLGTTLKERLRLLMRRDGLSYRQVADIAEVTEQAVYKWLSSGNISERNALLLAETFTVDWIWLKHGVTRIEPELLFELVASSLTSAAVFQSSTLSVIAAGETCLELLETDTDEVFAHPYYGYFTDCERDYHRRGLVIMSKVCGWAEVIARQRLLRVSGDKTTLIASGRLVTTARNGETYSLFMTRRDRPNGTENTARGVRIQVKSSMSPNLDDVAALAKRYPERAYLDDLLSERKPAGR